MAKELSQADRREYALFTDQNGREWGADVDTLSRGTCSAIAPRNFIDRINTPQKYLHANTSRRTLVVDFDQWIADSEEAHKRYTELCFDTAMQMYGENGPRMIEDKAPALMHMVGPAPEPTEPIRAARAGNKYCLGTSDKMPDWAIPFFVKPAPKVEEYPDVEDEYLDAEEQTDPNALGGKRQNPRKNKQTIEA